MPKFKSGNKYLESENFNEWNKRSLLDSLSNPAGVPFFGTPFSVS